MNRTLIMVIAVASVLALTAFAGYRAGYAKAEAIATASRLEFEKDARKAQDDSARRVADALAERDQALRDLADSQHDLDRVRGELGSASERLKRLPAASGSSGKCDSERLARCERLLSESADLLGTGIGLAQEGAELSGRAAANKDAIVRSLK